MHRIAVRPVNKFFADLSLAMAQMQICLAATYRKYYTRISPRTTEAMMEVDDGITSAGPLVRSLGDGANVIGTPLLDRIPRRKRYIGKFTSVVQRIDLF